MGWRLDPKQPRPEWDESVQLETDGELVWTGEIGLHRIASVLNDGRGCDTLVFCDGSNLSGNPGYAGWACLIIRRGVGHLYSGGFAPGTNNQAEMTALGKAFFLVPEGSKILAYTDSKYVQQGITSWIYGWERSGWLTKEGVEVQNADYWKRLKHLRARHEVVKTRWVPGHAGVFGNEWVDKEARRRASVIRAEAQPHMVDVKGWAKFSEFPVRVR